MLKGGSFQARCNLMARIKSIKKLQGEFCLSVLKTRTALLLLQYFEDVVSFDDKPLSPKVVTLCKHFLRMAQCFILFRKSSESAQKEW